MVEFGAAAGLPSWAAARSGARRVVATDQYTSEGFRALEMSAEANGTRGCSVRAAAHSWGEGVGEVTGGRPFDVAIASDCLYNPDGHRPLLESASACLRDGGIFLVGYSLHGNVPAEAVEAFFGAAEARGFRVDGGFGIQHDVQNAAKWSGVEGRGNVYIKRLVKEPTAT